MYTSFAIRARLETSGVTFGPQAVNQAYLTYILMSYGLILLGDVSGFRHLVELGQDKVAGMDFEIEFFPQGFLQSRLPLLCFLVSILSTTILSDSSKKLDRFIHTLKRSSFFEKLFLEKPICQL